LSWMEKQYAIYRGDSFDFMGTKSECIEYLGVKPDSFKFYLMPSYKKRLEKRKNLNQSLVVVDAGAEGDDEDEN
jgi:hypothetical protein